MAGHCTPCQRNLSVKSDQIAPEAAHDLNPFLSANDIIHKIMKTTIMLLVIFLFMLCIPVDVAAQDSREPEIRRLEDLERKAVMTSDSAALFNGLWSPGMVINAPANVVGTVEGTKALLRSGNLKYQSFERAIEKISFHDNVAVVMGEERIKPQGKQPHAGKLVTRRFTNVWQYANEKWSIIARQATIIKVE